MPVADKISKTKYNTTHKYMLRNYKKTGVCDHCNSVTKTQWANKSGNYDRRDIDDWLELCPKCHSKYDGRTSGFDFNHNYELEKQTGRPSKKVSKSNKPLTPFNLLPYSLT